MHQLEQMQLTNGSWPWFPGGHPNDYITLYVTTGFGWLRHLGVEVDIAPAVKALGNLDEWMQESYECIQERVHPKLYVPSPMISIYLHSRTASFHDFRSLTNHYAIMDSFTLFVAGALGLRSTQMLLEFLISSYMTINRGL